jgi:hypothetical protein
MARRTQRVVIHFIGLAACLAILVSGSVLAQDSDADESLGDQVEDVQPGGDQPPPDSTTQTSPPPSVPSSPAGAPPPQGQAAEPTTAPLIVVAPATTESAAPAYAVPSGPAAPLSCVGGTSVSVAKDPSFAGESLTWRAQGFAPGTFITYSLWRVSDYRRGERADAGTPNFRATVNGQCIAGAGYTDEYYPPATNPSGRYVLVVSGLRYPDRIDATNSVEFNLIQTVRATPRPEIDHRAVLTPTSIPVTCFPRPC